ncbi:MAG: hypothetical protein FWE25_01495 [Lachnospiraceae bacterium]|nr:hypothetical protein [Lachnospiraceae bacterium]
MKLKKVIATVMICASLVTVPAMTVSAQETEDVIISTIDENGEVITQGYIDLDPYIDMTAPPEEPITIFWVSPSMRSGKPSKPNADGGYFWVAWDGDRHHEKGVLGWRGLLRAL